MPSPCSGPGYRALRRGRRSGPDQVYLLTTTTWDRRRLFADHENAFAVAAVLREDRLWRDSQLLCWTLMPDHLHLLLSLGHAEPLPKLMQRVKAITSAAADVDTIPRIRRTWMPGFHDHALRREEDIAAVARYVVMNPVRAGLVERTRDYPFRGSIWT